MPVAVTPMGQGALPMVIRRYVLYAYKSYLRRMATSRKSFFSMQSRIFSRFVRMSKGIFYDEEIETASPSLCTI